MRILPIFILIGLLIWMWFDRRDLVAQLETATAKVEKMDAMQKELDRLKAAVVKKQNWFDEKINSGNTFNPAGTSNLKGTSLDNPSTRGSQGKR